MDTTIHNQLRILKLNVEGLTGSKFLLIEELALFAKVLVILLQGTYCSSANELVIPNFTLSVFILSRKRCLVTFVNNKYFCFTLIDRYSDFSKIEWLLIDAYNLKTINIYKPPIFTTYIKADFRIPPSLSQCWQLRHVQRNQLAFYLAAETVKLTPTCHLRESARTCSFLTDACSQSSLATSPTFADIVSKSCGSNSEL